MLIDDDISVRLGWWLANGEKGASSLAIAATMLGAKIEQNRDNCHRYIELEKKPER